MSNIPLRPEEMPRNTLGGSDENRKKLERVTTGVRSNAGKSRLSRFVQEDCRAVGDYIFNDVLLPAVKDLVVDMVRQGIERTVYGESGAPRRGPRGYSSRGYTSYNSIGSSRTREDGPGYRREITRTQRSSHSFSDIIIPTRSEALDVLDGLEGQIEQFGVVSVADLYDLVGITSEFTDESWGWDNLRNATVKQTRAGFILDLPRPQSLKG